jgi:hypothetical protein
MNRNSVAAIIATGAVVVVLVLGFRFLGSPARQRLARLDAQDVWSLFGLAQRLNHYRTGPADTLPENLDKIKVIGTKTTSVSGKPFAYHRKDENHYELCATFATDTRENRDPNVSDFWLHPKGDYCFQFDAREGVQQAPVPNLPY